jgi:DNA repair exonuclease SbcCD ATPase subunit
VTKFEVKNMVTKLHRFHCKCMNRLGRKFIRPWKEAVQTARVALVKFGMPTYQLRVRVFACMSCARACVRACVMRPGPLTETTCITVKEGNESRKNAEKNLSEGDIDGSLKKLRRAEERVGFICPISIQSAWNSVPPLHADWTYEKRELAFCIRFGSEEDFKDSSATWMAQKIANAQHRCKLLRRNIDTDKSILQAIKAELHTLSKNEAGSKKQRAKLTKQKAELEKQIQSNNDALSSNKDPNNCGAEAYVSILMDLEASSEKLKALAQEIDVCEQFLSQGKTHMENAVKKVSRNAPTTFL